MIMKKLIFAVVMIALLTGTTGCKRLIRNTTVFVEDSVRHYFPIRQGEELSILYNIENTGEEPLIIQDIHTSCGCIVIDQDAERLVPPNGNSYLHMKYNSRKNVGEVRHTVRIYGNIEPRGVKELKFIVNVVPDPDYTRDYEELYRETTEGGAVGDIVDGKMRYKGYYIKGYYPEEVISPSHTQRREENDPFNR